MADVLLLAFVCSATAHWIAAAVMSLYARYQVQYLCLAWVDGILAAALTICAVMSDSISAGQPVLMHPLMMVALVGTCYLQSIYPLSIPMPGFLQLGRMIKYALPAFILIVLYALGFFFGEKWLELRSLHDVVRNFFTFDVFLRLVSLGLAFYYVLNILLLPRLMAKRANVPRYMIGYCFALSLVNLFYIYITLSYSQTRLLVYIFLFTFVSLYLTFRTLETMAIHLPKPVLTTVSEEPSVEEVEQAEHEDFNEANLQRFQRIQYWMQNNVKLWTESTFNREGLCDGVGYNRHLVLQSVRSQGFNNVHDYINSYRVDHLKRQIRRGKVTTISECLDSGFGTTKTVRTCFAKHEGISLDEYLAQYSRSERDANAENFDEEMG